MHEQVEIIVERIGVERARFERFCRSLSEEELNRPVPDSTWQVRDFISHLATIDRPIAVWFGTIAAGQPRSPSAAMPGDRAWNVDRFNDARVAERRERSVEELLQEAEQERTALIAVLERLTEEHLARTIAFGGDRKRPPSEMALARYLQGWSRHDVIHVADMLKALPEQRAGPEIMAWLAEPEVQAMVAYYQKAMA